jgi:transposase InsO family protein
MFLPLKPIVTHGPFQQWGLDFIGEINSSSSVKHKWILTYIDYFTKCIESISTRNATDRVIMDFLEGYNFSRFGCPKKLVTDNAQAFKLNSMIEFCNKYSIKLVHSTPYYPQGNGLA